MAVTPEQIADFQRAREQKLLERWGSGARLSTEERAEIAHLLPAPKSAASAEVEKPAPPFTLDPVPETSEETGLQHPLVAGSPYEDTYAADIRTIKRWRKVGRLSTPPVLPPLDEPWSMANWWRKHMTRVVPPRLIQLEEAGAPKKPAAPSNSTQSPATAPTSAAPSTSAASTTPVPGAATSATAPTTSTVKTGYAAVLARFQEAEAVAFERYIDAFKSPDPTVRETAPALKREWNELAETMRNYERDAAKILSASGNLWDATQVLETITTIHTTIFAGIRRLHRRMRQLHPDAHLLPVAKQDALWDAQVDALANALNNSAYTSAALPTPESPVNLTPAPAEPTAGSAPAPVSVAA